MQAVVFIATAAAIYSLVHGLCTLTAVPRSTQHSTLHGMVNINLYSAIITKVSNALNTLVYGEKPGFQALSKGLIVLLCAEVVRQGVPDHGAVHSKCSASNSGWDGKMSISLQAK